MAHREKVLITVKTYPTLSSKYGELVCTAGVKEDGTWIRLYPLPFRLLNEDEKFKKYTWIEIDLEKHSSDIRLESYRPCNFESIKKIGIIDTGKTKNWMERKSIILDKCEVYHDMHMLIGKAKNNEISLAVFKASEITNFVYEEIERDWDPEKIKRFEAKILQMNLFDVDEEKEALRVMPKLPYKFSYEFKDIKGRKSKLMISDWEVGQLFWNCMKRNGHNEQDALAKVKQKYYHDFALKRDLYYYLGTTKEHHFRSRNPFIIIGTFHPPFPPPVQQLNLL